MSARMDAGWGRHEDGAVKLHGAFTINDRVYSAGEEVPWWTIYPLFLFHMAAFGLTGFWLPYAPGSESLQWSNFLFSGFAILCYLPFYGLMFGRDGVKWMFINAALCLFEIVSQTKWILSLFGRTVSDYPLANHVIPIIYFVMYTFLLRHAALKLPAGAPPRPPRASRPAPPVRPALPPPSAAGGGRGAATQSETATHGGQTLASAEPPATGWRGFSLNARLS